MLLSKSHIVNKEKLVRNIIERGLKAAQFNPLSIIIFLATFSLLLTCDLLSNIELYFGSTMAVTFKGKYQVKYLIFLELP